MTSNLTTMESLALPEDLYWDGKMEPISPPNSELFAVCEDFHGNWLASSDNIANDVKIVSQHDLELKHHDVDLAEDLLDSEDLIMEYYDLKVENFYSPSQILDNSLDSPITNPTQVIKVQNTPDINQFGFANRNISILTQLTPPSSPPQTAAPSSAPASPVLQTASGSLPLDINDVLHSNQTTSEPTSPSPQVQNQFGFAYWHNPNYQSTTETAAAAADDIEFHTQIIDDILKLAADEIFEESESQSSISAPSQGGYTTTDDEWLPSPSSGSCSPLQHLSTESFSESSSGASSPASTKKRTRPYGRGVEDRKIRKKEQNKNAATRYRQKKKLEMEYILIEEQELTKRHEELKLQLAERKREAKYLKTLIREFYSKKKL